MSVRLRKLVAALAIIIGAAAPVAAGTVSVAWDPVTDTDLAGYRVYYGSAPGSYSQSTDVGNVTSTTLTLADCQTWYVAVKAYDTAGNESSSYSNEVSGWARPVVTTVTPNAAEQGRTLNLTITGSNFQSGATLAFSNTGVVVNSVTINSCTQLTANVSVSGTATPGATNAEVTNPDLVFGTGVGVFTVQAAAAPQVASTNPLDGQPNIPVTVHPTVTFSEAMLASSITTSTVRLLDAVTGTPVTQAAGSPSLSTDGLTATITPAANLTAGKTYKIQVIGGATGVMDLANHPMASNFLQGTGFSTQTDTTAPTISSVASSNVGSTTATITWTTNESADSQVFYRRTGDAAYQSTDIDPTMVTSHSSNLKGLAPSTSYEYYVRSADAAGNATTSSPTKNFTTTANSFAYLRFEAEGGILVAPVRTQSGTGSFAGGWVDTPAGTPVGSATAPSGTATFGVNVPSAGTWYLWVRMYGPDANSDSWFESVNGASRQAIVASQPGVWQWVQGRSYSLSAGLANVELGGREAQARADRVLLTNDGTFVPTEQPVGDQTPTAPLSSFTGTPANLQVTLNWTNPTTTDFQRTVIRYRTDGRYPTSPVDGGAVADRAAAPGSTDSFVHGGLTNGTTYYYAAFALDAAGNPSTASKVSATPADTTAPGNVRNTRRTDKKVP